MVRVWLLQVCRAAGYYQHALFVSQAAAETEWYLDILLEDMQSWDAALAYLQDLPRQQAAAALKKHGKVGASQRNGRNCVLLQNRHWVRH